MNSIYLDNAAATPIDSEIFDSKLILDFWFNPSSKYQDGKKAKNLLEKSRLKAAEILGCDSSEIYFTPSATISNNIAINGFMNNYPGDNIIISNLEHPSVLEQKNNNFFETRIVKANEFGLVDINDILNLIDDKTRLISLMYVNNVLGTIQPLLELSRRIIDINIQRKIDGLDPIVLHTDAVQAFNYLDINLSILNVDLLTISSSKIFTPRGCSILYIKKGLKIQPLFYGGNQEKGLISGTTNPAICHFFVTGMEKSKLILESENIRLGDLKKLIVDRINELENVKLVLTNSETISSILTLGFKAIDQDTLTTLMDLNNISIGALSSCSSGGNQKSDFMETVGLGVDFDSFIRVSMGRFTTKTEIAKFISILKTNFN